MSEWQKVKIGDLFNIEKGSLQSSKCTIGDFDFITASSEWKKHNEYTHETEALIVAVAASGSLGRVHYVNGKFISSDLCFILTPKNPDKYPLDFEFYYHIFRSIRDDLVKRTATGTSKLAINKGNFSNYKLPYFDIDHQKKFCGKLISIENKKGQLQENSTFQQSRLTLLRQQILQDAISGKLTADWRAENPDTEPASELLEQIKVEKEKLIAEKKIKKEKALPLILEDEVPFELPEGWKWCRLGDVGFTQTGTTPPTQDKSNFGDDISFIKPADIKISWDIDYENEKLSNKGLKLGRLIESGSAMMVCIGGSIGKSGICSMDVSCNQQINTITPLADTDSWYIQYLLQSPYFQKTVWNRASGGTTPIVNKTKWETIPFPLPPRAEQRAIVAKVERLMGYVSQLEEKIAQNANSAETLMQAFLGEVFRK